MPSYRIELASTGRAGCTNKECKDNKIKIPKGDLRFGSWVDNGQFQSFFWRHWGCVSPKIVSNINELIGEGDDRDLDMLDGYEDLSPEIQKKIERALEQGHIDDEDWNGDREMNVPGSNGFRVRTPKKKAKAAEKEEKGGEKEEEEKPKSSKTKKRSHAQVDEDSKDAGTAEPKRPKRKSAGATKKAPVSSEDEDEKDDDSEFPEPKAKASKRGRQSKESKPAATTGAKRGRKAKGADDDAEAEPVEEKPKRGRKKKTT
ncbi:hypothetical protein ASPVEDRAFT_39303 [Aspergillus versicolor CBS 583.65]|uniref:PARP-type domain-containing protein n=1 Tax=Aspergillus versicolor CBS 583.65 TaxID=1036611 RepID=A0A1L9PEI0_ASPVE|nr:uncharacterized protein ASPVEDRAFT_39303 [Aspergillus versicolor CBS 583.65]OJI99927.1 hypothetical protein ASPVEDRAFT_39303 [Aspergillus versicolor CBS 583.65]